MGKRITQKKGNWSTIKIGWIKMKSTKKKNQKIKFKINHKKLTC